jgi:hypothetical protein
MRKPFDRELYDQDDNAKHKVVAWLQTLGYPAEVNPDQYGIDIIAVLPERTVGWEVEVKHAWTGEAFPFPTVHIADRKRKFANDNCYFLMLNEPRNRILSISAAQVRDAPTVYKQTIYTAREGFVEIHAAQCQFFSVQP